MNNPNPENPPEASDAPEAPVVSAPPPMDNRRRLRELLSIPERDRSDEQWDEIIELEIQLAPGNRVSPNEPMGGNQGRGGMQHGKQGGNNPGAGQGQQQKKHRPRTNNNRRQRQNKPQTGGGGTPAA